VYPVAFEFFRRSQWLPRRPLVTSLMPATLTALSWVPQRLDKVCIHFLCACLDTSWVSTRISIISVLLLFNVSPSGHTIRAWSIVHRLSIPMAKRCQLLVAMFYPLPIRPVFSCAHRSPLSSSDNRPPTNQGAPLPSQGWIGKIGSASTAFGWFILVFPFLFVVVLTFNYNSPNGFKYRSDLVCSTAFLPVVSCTFGWTGIYFSSCFPVFFSLLIVGSMRVSVLCDQLDAV